MYETYLVKNVSLNEFPAKDGRFYVIATITDGRQYQVKFNVANSAGNQKELISNFVGKEMEASVLDGAYLQFSQRQIEWVINQIKSFRAIVPNLECFSKNIFFGVEWHVAARKLSNEDELQEALLECKNQKEFFCVFPFDQYLRNYDRFYKNHLVVKKSGDKKPSHYAVIDGDRIFGCTSWNELDNEKIKFKCFSEPFHKGLYNLVKDTDYTQVYKYLAKVGLVSVSNLIIEMDKIYDDPKLIHGKIKDVLEYRKDKMFDYCDGSCFPNVKKKRLSCE